MVVCGWGTGAAIWCQCFREFLCFLYIMIRFQRHNIYWINGPVGCCGKNCTLGYFWDVLHYGFSYQGVFRVTPALCPGKGGGESIGPSGRPRTLGGLQERWRLPSVESSEFFPPFFTAAKKHTREFYCVSCQVSRRWLAFCSKGWKCKANKSGEESLSSRYGFAKKRSKGSFDILLMEKTLGIF